jgi:invasion protein IalB
MRFRSAIQLGVVAGLLWTNSSFAQINQNDGPLVAPIQPEPTVGLPEQAPPPAQPVPMPQRETRSPQQAATPTQAKQPAPEAANTSAWQLECLEREAQIRTCQAILRSRVGDQIAMVFAVAKDLNDDAIHLQMALPLGIDVQRGITLSIDDFNQTLKPTRCTAQGCLVETTASPDLMAAFRSGETGGVRVYSTDGQTIDLPMSLQSVSSVFQQADLD